MQPNSTVAAPAYCPQRGDKQYGRSRVTNNPAFLPKQPLSGRAIARRRKDLVAAFLAALGGPEAVSLVVAMQVRRAAELVTAAEMARATMLNGVPTDMLALIRLEGVASRAVRLLGLKVEPAKAPPRFLEMRRQRWAAQEQQAKAAQTVREAAQNNTTMEQPPDGTAE